ncbi:MAG: peptidylprolyl isomerase [Anaerolineae bacterium]|nr:peptidylprolyl isomerase [Anaerolineae bacterium]
MKSVNLFVSGILLALATVMLISCGQATPTAVPTDTPTPVIEEPTPTPSPVAVASPTAVPSPAPTISVIPSITVTVVAKVNSVELSRDDFEQAMARDAKLIAQQYGMDWNDPQAQGLLPELQQSVLDRLINQELLRQLAEAEGLTPTEDEVRAEVEAAKAQIQEEGPFADLDEFLESSGLTEADIETLIRGGVMQEKMLDAHGGPNEMEQVHARHILVETEEEGDAVLAKLEEGEDFADLAAEYSIDTGSQEDGGDLGWFPREVMVAEFEEAAFGLEIGETSELVQTQFGYHVIEVLEREVRELGPQLLQAFQQKVFEEWFAKQVELAEIERFVSFME